MKQLDKLRIAFADANIEVPRYEEDYVCDEDLEGKPLPVTLWETVYTYQGEHLIGGEVKPITVTSHGISWDSARPVIGFVTQDGREARGSVGMFYMSEDKAQAEVDNHVASARKQAAEQELFTLTRDILPDLLLALGALEEIAQKTPSEYSYDTVQMAEDMRKLARSTLNNLKGI